jgi:hypothetical protein
MKLELLNLFFFAFRLGPFLLISFFILTSFFQQDIKCIVYIVGIVIACFLGILTGNSLSIFEFPPTLKETASLCHIITLGESGPLSKIPLSTLIYTYTAMYLAFPLHPSLWGVSNPVKADTTATTTDTTTTDASTNELSDATKSLMSTPYSALSKNKPNKSINSDLPLFFLFPFLILIDALWMIQYHCFNTYSVITGGIIGICVGMAWSYIVGSSGNSPYHYFSILGGSQVCEKPSGTTFRCISRKNDTSINLSQILENKNNNPKGYYVSQDGTTISIADGETIQCRNLDNQFYRYNYSNNNLQLYPSKEIAQSWNPKYVVNATVIKDCSNFIIDETNMKMNDGLYSCTLNGYGCSSTNMPMDGTEVSCMNMQNNKQRLSSSIKSSNTMPVNIYRVDKGKLCLLPSDEIRQSWQNVPEGSTSIEIQDCSGLPMGPDMQLNTKSTNIEMVYPNSSEYAGNKIPVGSSITCTSGSPCSTSSITQINGQIVYRYMEDGTLSAYNTSDTNVLNSWNPNYSDIITINDCDKYKSLFTCKTITTSNTDLYSNEKYIIIQKMISDINLYFQIYSLTNMQDINKNLIQLQLDLKQMLDGYLLSKDMKWKSTDATTVSTDTTNVVKDLNNKGTDYSKSLATNIQGRINSILALQSS